MPLSTVIGNAPAFLHAVIQIVAQLMARLGRSRHNIYNGFVR